MGLRLSEGDISKYEQPTVERRMLFSAAPAALPRQFDWRYVPKGDYVTPVRYQDTCGSCVAFAVCASLESRIRIQRDDPTLELDLSEAHLFFCGCGECCDTGWTPDQALEFCVEKGVCEEAQFPYQSRNTPCPDTPFRCSTISGFNVLTDARERRLAIAERGPVIAGMEVYVDLAYYAGGVYENVYGDPTGLHAVCVVGYDDDQEYWIIKNSWSDKWGEDGYVRLKYGECKLDGEHPFWEPLLKQEGHHGNLNPHNSPA